MSGFPSISGILRFTFFITLGLGAKLYALNKKARAQNPGFFIESSSSN
jgi:hypothetical protein